MAHIAFFVDHEEGHVFPSLGLAKQLARRGHRVTYVGAHAVAQVVRREGFDFSPAMELPERPSESTPRAHYTLFFDSSGQIDRALRKLQPDIVILLSLMPLEALMLKSRYGIPVAFVRTYYSDLPRRERVSSLCWLILRQAYRIQEVIRALKDGGLAAGRVEDIVAAVSAVPEIIPLPPEFEGRDDSDGSEFYIGPAVDQERVEDTSGCESAGQRTPAILCTLGSQCHLEKEVSLRFFQVVLQCAQMRPEWSFVVSTGRRLCLQDQHVPSNALVTAWVPQLHMLKRVQALVSHAGIGTVREAAAAGVPDGPFSVDA